MKPRLQTWILMGAGLLCLVPAFLPREAEGTPPRRALTSLAASWQWIQFDQSLAKGSWEQAYLHADRALALDSESPQGWIALATNLIFLRASFQNEPDDQKRIAWMQAGIDVLLEGTRRSRDPGQVHLVLGQTLTFFIAYLADMDEDPLPWPGGAEAARELGLEHLRLAEGLGHSGAQQSLEILLGPHDHPHVGD
ncbi:MAG: hypothetical protein JKY61_06575 [Planctomycetes bacterium]|nr:hypothetical protein [Planctomycetota bacterium]